MLMSCAGSSNNSAFLEDLSRMQQHFKPDYNKLCCSDSSKMLMTCAGFSNNSPFFEDPSQMQKHLWRVRTT